MEAKVKLFLLLWMGFGGVQAASYRFFDKGTIKPETLLQQQLPNMEGYAPIDWQWKEIYRVNSPALTHVLYELRFQNRKVYDVQLKLNLFPGETVASMYSSAVPEQWIGVHQQETRAVPLLGTDSVVHQESVWIIRNQHLESAMLYRVKPLGNPCLSERVYLQDQLLSQQELCDHFTDTTLSLKVFKPDPLSSAGQTYGGWYVDSNDADLPVLRNELKPATVTGSWDQGIFYLKNKHISIEELDAPVIPPVNSTDGVFHFNRSQSGFEDVNVFYHLNQIWNYVDQLGFSGIDSVLTADPHALNGADNSLFSYSSSPPALLLGIGGVDDGEDADVIVHEFSHFLARSFAPATNSGLQRRAIDEGFGDYMASSYSKVLTGFGADEVFNWDGHNVYWNGRSVSGTKTYPADQVGNIYKDGEIWSACMVLLREDLGRTLFDSILFQSIYSYAAGMGFFDAAQLLLNADTLLFNGVHTCALAYRLSQRGLLEEGWLHPCFNAIDEPGATLPFTLYADWNGWHVSNPENQEITFKVFSITGQLMELKKISQNHYFSGLPEWPSGCYVVMATHSAGTRTLKWIKP